jgi:Asp-tRNA(Asn)/Glu-tRNA(Gln) amidotransferase A subunit family amidase
VGVFARSVPDAALLASALVGRDGRDPSETVNESAIDAEVFARNQPPRLVAVRSPVWHLAEESAQHHFQETVRRLREAGAAVVEVELPAPFSEAHAVHRIIMYGEGARVLEQVQRLHREKLSPRLNALIDEGLRIPEEALDLARETGRTLRGELDRFLNDVDGLITPPTPGEAPADLGQTGDPAFCTIWTLCDVPAITIPTGRGPRGLPLGLQIVGRRFHDDGLLSMAQWCDERIGWPQRVVE